MPAASSFRFYSLLRTVIRGLLVWFLLPLTIFCVALLASLYLFCIFKPELTAAFIQQNLRSATHLPWLVKGEVRPVFSSAFGIMASNVQILAATPEQEYCADPERPLVQVQNVRLYFDLLALARLALRLDRIELDSPVLSLAYDKECRPLWLPLEPTPESTPAPQGENAFPDPDSSAAVPVVPQPAESAAPVDARESFAGIVHFLRSEAADVLPPFVIRNGTFRRYNDKGTLLLAFNNVDAELHPRSPNEMLLFGATFSLPGAGLDVAFKVSAGLGDSPALVQGRLSGTVGMTPPGSRTISGEFSTAFSWQENGADLLLPDFSLVAETDAITANLSVDITKPLATGPVMIHKLSLPRWFGFGRSLPSGLQEPLNMLVGEFSLYFDATKVEARNLRGVVGEMAVSGLVGTPDFSKPVVVVDLDMDQANLDTLFPFLSAVGTYVRDPVSPEFTHSVLAPFPEEKKLVGPRAEDDAEIDVSYDVKVRVAKPFVHDVAGGSLEVLVFPITVGKEDKTRVAFAGDKLLTGRAEGWLDIDEKNVLMHYDVKGMDLGLLPENAQNSVRIDGVINGICDITIPVKEGNHWADTWKVSGDVGITGCEITGKTSGTPWRLFAKTVKAAGDGSIYTVVSKGVVLDGLWNLAVQGVNTSWNPRGNDAISGQFKGGLTWPPIAPGPLLPHSKHGKDRQRKGVERISGTLTATGGLMAPLASRLVPVKGKLRTDITWLLYDEKVDFTALRFEGFGSYASGSVGIDATGKDIAIQASSELNISLQDLLRAWNMMPPPEVQMPKLVAGKAEISAKPGAVRFDKLKFEVDGAPVTGEIAWDGSGATGGKSGAQAGNLWTFRLAAEQLDIDSYFPPAAPGAKAEPPSQTPWNLSFLQGLSLDIQLFLNKAKFQRMNFEHSKVTGTLQRSRFTLHSQIDDLYGGKATVLLQGTVVPEKSQITLSKGLAELKGVALGKALHDLTKDTSYAGTADVVVDLSGVMQCSADMPGKLSGIWSLNITDGLYPAFIGTSASRLRNTFSKASASGLLDKGVVRWDNFSLQGAMVDMFGDGWLDLNKKEMDIKISVTLAKIPTVPVRFYGPMAQPRMSVRGVHMVLHTVQAAGNTMFSLLKGVLELPGRAVNGIGEMFGGDVEKAPESAPAPAPKPSPAQKPKPRKSKIPPVKEMGR